MLIECKYYDVAAKEMEELDKQIGKPLADKLRGENYSWKMTGEIFS